MESSVPETHTFLHLFRAAVNEFCGTAMTVYAFNFSKANYMVRGFAYFVGWLLAVSVSGAHFNPATSLAVYLVEGKYLRQIGRLLVYWLFQFAGAFGGILITYLVFNFPFNGYLLWPMVQNPDARIWYFSELGNIYYAKIIFLEILNSFMFIYAYLLVIYKPSLRTVDEIIKGLGLSVVLWVAYVLCADAGACLNPALGLAQSAYQVTIINDFNNNGNGFASLIWVYIVFPFVGGIIAAIIFRIRIWMDNKAMQ